MTHLVLPQSMEALAIAPLNDMLTHLNSLAMLLSTSNSTATYSTLPGLTSSLIAADDNLNTSLAALRQHQDNYARILTLRAEAERLDSEIKIIVRRADSLRKDIGNIDQSILDDTDSDDDEVHDVDYQMLLNFAARIGKHNSIAAQEAENESERLRLQSRSGSGEQSTQPQENDDIATTKSHMAAESAAHRAAMGMAFPDSTRLRIGALGRLQLLHESEGGAAAVDAEVDRLVKETEPVEQTRGSLVEMERVRAEKDKEQKDRERKEREAARRRAAAAAKAKAEGKPEEKPKPKKTLNLDFESDDDSDDE